MNITIVEYSGVSESVGRGLTSHTHVEMERIQLTMSRARGPLSIVIMLREKKNCVKVLVKVCDRMIKSIELSMEFNLNP